MVTALNCLILNSCFSGLITQQGMEIQPRCSKSQLVFLLGYLFGLVCFSGFTANIVTTLTSIESLDSLEEFLDYEGIQKVSAYLI